MKLLFLCISMFLGTLAPQDKLDYARSLLKEGKIEEAKAVCQEVSKQGPNYIKALDMLDDIETWQKTLKEGSANAVSLYLSGGRGERLFETEAVALLSELLEKETWQKVLRVDKPKTYELFLQEHPESPYTTEALNHLAQALADEFKKKSTIEDKEHALQYAMDEATREYVEYAFAAATQTFDPSITYHTNPQAFYQANKERKKVTVAIGVTATGAMSKHKWGAFHASTDKYVMEYVAGAGVAVRLGDISKTTNSVFSVYCLRDECMLYKPKVVYSGALAFDENWNFYRSKRMAAFLDAGMMLELPFIVEARFGAGLAWKHGEWKTGILLYKSLVETPTMLVPLYGTSLTYFF